MDTKLHIIAFDVPYPADYGGIIDLYFQLKSLHKLGVKITYHCFYYEGNNPKTDQLNGFCEHVYYYHRKKNIGKMMFNKLPFIVATRQDKDLLKNLLKDNNPILFSGIQTCYFLNHPKLKNRKKIFRAHNIEHDYYNGLAQVEPNQLKRRFFLLEAKKLQKFEAILNQVNVILSITKKDVSYFSKYAATYHIPAFFRQNDINYNLPELTNYGLFQGNLSVVENIHTVNFILNNIASKTKSKIIIAGKSPNKKLVKEIEKYSNVELIENPKQEQMNTLIKNAQVHLLFTAQQTGVKLKLLHALSVGKHVIINSLMDDDGLFSNLCVIENDPDKILRKFEQLMTTLFNVDYQKKRKLAFNTYFNNGENALKLIDIVNNIE